MKLPVLNEKIIFVIPKNLRATASSITKDSCLHPLQKAAALRGIAKETPAGQVKHGNYCKFNITYIPTYNHVITSSGKMIQKVGSDISCDWAVVTVACGKVVYTTAWGHMEEKLSNGMILLED